VANEVRLVLEVLHVQTTLYMPGARSKICVSLDGPGVALGLSVKIGARDNRLVVRLGDVAPLHDMSFAFQIRSC
jgi:hypothetical protein